MDSIETRAFAGLEPDAARRRYMTGDAMLGTVSPNSPMLTEPVEGFVAPGLYVIELDGREVLAAVQPVGGGAWVIRYDNPRYEPETLLPVEGSDGRYTSSITGLAVTLRFLERVRMYAVAT